MQFVLAFELKKKWTSVASFSQCNIAIWLFDLSLSLLVSRPISEFYGAVCQCRVQLIWNRRVLHTLVHHNNKNDNNTIEKEGRKKNNQTSHSRYMYAIVTMVQTCTPFRKGDNKNVGGQLSLFFRNHFRYIRVYWMQYHRIVGAYCMPSRDDGHCLFPDRVVSYAPIWFYYNIIALSLLIHWCSLENWKSHGKYCSAM